MKINIIVICKEIHHAENINNGDKIPFDFRFNVNHVGQASDAIIGHVPFNWFPIRKITYKNMRNVS